MSFVCGLLTSVEILRAYIGNLLFRTVEEKGNLPPQEQLVLLPYLRRTIWIGIST